MRSVSSKEAAICLVTCTVLSMVFVLLDTYAIVLWLLWERGSEAIVLRIIASAVIALLGYVTLPDDYKTKKRDSFLLFAISLSIPVFGPIAVIFSVVYSLRKQPAEKAEDWQLLPMLQMPTEPVTVTESPIYVYSGLVTLLNRFTSNELRRRALLATTNMSSRISLPIILLGINDEVDETRLLAYTMLNKKQTTIENAIKNIQKQLEVFKSKGQKRQVAVCYEELAVQAQEIAQIQKNEELSFVYWVTSAKQAILNAIDIENSPRRQFLYAKILMQLGCLDEAERFFEYSEALGYPIHKTIPYRAEIAYRKGELTQVRAQLNRSKDYLNKVPKVRPVVEYWQ